jgi:hypothetical protein
MAGRKRSPKGNPTAKTKFRPLHDRVVVKRIDAEQNTRAASSFRISAKEKPPPGGLVFGDLCGGLIEGPDSLSRNFECARFSSV